MKNARIMRENNKLFVDYSYRQNNFKVVTDLKDTKANRKFLGRIITRIDRDNDDASNIPVFSNFSIEWYQENLIKWRDSYAKKTLAVINNYLIPAFGPMLLSDIDRGKIFKFRADIPSNSKSGRGIKTDFINNIMCILSQILSEGSKRFDFEYPMDGIKALPVPKVPVHPFTVEEVKKFLNEVPDEYRNYFVLAFLSGMRCSELTGLSWDYVDFNRREIMVRQAYVLGKIVPPKNSPSVREIPMSNLVYQALADQHAKTGHLGGFVFLDSAGDPLCVKYLRRSVWYPALKRLGLRSRKLGQTRHTAATLWLISGENLTWIARILGHSSTEMLFKRYAHYIKNMIGIDGTSFDKLYSDILISDKEDDLTNSVHVDPSED